MKKILLLALLGLSLSAHAGWTNVEFVGDEVTLHVDMATLKDTGHGTAEMWYVINYASVQKVDDKPFRSIKGQSEYDCAKGMSREMLHLWHIDPMGNNKLVQFSHAPNAWIVPEAGSIEQTLMQVACKRQ